ncbi:SNARE associated Golgi protein, partial [Musa troglodytarum]
AQRGDARHPGSDGSLHHLRYYAHPGSERPPGVGTGGELSGIVQVLDHIVGIGDQAALGGHTPPLDSLCFLFHLQGSQGSANCMPSPMARNPAPGFRSVFGEGDVTHEIRLSRVSLFRVLSTEQSNSSSGSGRWSPCWSFLRVESLPSTLHRFAPIKQKERKGTTKRKPLLFLAPPSPPSPPVSLRILDRSSARGLGDLPFVKNLYERFCGTPRKMSNSSEMSGKNVETSELQTMEDEHARLVLPSESRIANFDSQQVLLPIMEWEATAFGRPVLALVLVGSLALFPIVLIPSGPSMWLAGMIFGYGLGFLIIMVGTTIGMVLPYFIGLLFRERIHEWLNKWPQQTAILRLAGEGSCGSIAGMIPEAFIYIYSGRLIRTLANMKYRNYTMTPVEIVYNIISFLIAIAITIAFTVYARRALGDLRKAESSISRGDNLNGSSIELEKLPQERRRILHHQSVMYDTTKLHALEGTDIRGGIDGLTRNLYQRSQEKVIHGNFCS